jgi:hypothetical protein
MAKVFLAFIFMQLLRSDGNSAQFIESGTADFSCNVVDR